MLNEIKIINREVTSIDIYTGIWIKANTFGTRVTPCANILKDEKSAIVIA